MTLGLILTGTFLAHNTAAAAASWWIERNGLPPDVSSQTVARKPGALRQRAPLMLLNLVLLTGGAFVGMTLAAPLFSTAWPGLAAFFAQLVTILLLDDAVFYALHRAMHTHPTLYRLLHAKHHESYAPSPIEILYSHPGESGLVSLGIVAGAGVVWAAWGSVHFGAFLSYVIFRHLHELDLHSGVRSRLAHHLPLLAPNEHHDLHHHRPHAGNYGSMTTLWDRVFGTEAIDDRRSVQAARLAAKAKRAA